MKRILLSIVLLILLAGCALMSPLPPPSPPLTTSAGQHPQLNEETEVTAGSVLFSEWNYVSQPVAFLPKTGENIPRAGIAADGTESYCCDGAPLYHPYRDYYENTTICFFSSNGKIFDRWQQSFAGRNPQRIDLPIPFTRTEIIKFGLKYKLIYNGIENKVLKLTYKEYRGNLSAPTSTRELTYPIPKIPATIELSGMPTSAYAVEQSPPKIEVLGIQGNTIRYKVLSGYLTPSQDQPQQTEPGQQSGQSQ